MIALRLDLNMVSLPLYGCESLGGADVGRELDFEDVALSLMGDFQLKAVLFFVFNQ